MQKKPEISVIIPSHRPEMIANLIRLLSAQKRSAENTIQLIVVTDYPVGNLRQQLPECTWVQIKEKSISKKRNRGLQIATGSICALIDDDCLPADDWLQQGTTFLNRHPEVTAVEGKTVIEKQTGSSNAALREYRRLEKPGFRTNNLFFRTALLRTLGGFDERFTVQREDIDLAFSAIDHGYLYSYHPEISVTHRFRPGEKWDLLKNCWNRRFDPLLHKKHPDLYRIHIGSPLTPTLQLAVPLYLSVLLAVLKKRHRLPAALLVAGYGILCGARRSSCRISWWHEAVQCCAAPVVTAAALLVGSVRYRTFLLF